MVGLAPETAMEIRLFGSFEVVVDGRLSAVTGSGRCSPRQPRERPYRCACRSFAGRLVSSSAGCPAGTSWMSTRTTWTCTASPGWSPVAGSKRPWPCTGAPALVEFTDQDWARLEATRPQELYLDAVEEHVEERLKAGGDVGLVSELLGLVSATRFGNGCATGSCSHSTGRTADALACYQEGRRLLCEELGLDPSDALRQLEGAILRQDPMLQAPLRSANAPRTSRRASAPSSGGRRT